MSKKEIANTGELYITRFEQWIANGFLKSSSDRKTVEYFRTTLNNYKIEPTTANLIRLLDALIDTNGITGSLELVGWQTDLGNAIQTELHSNKEWKKYLEREQSFWLDVDTTLILPKTARKLEKLRSKGVECAGNVLATKTNRNVCLKLNSINSLRGNYNRPPSRKYTQIIAHKRQNSILLPFHTHTDAGLEQPSEADFVFSHLLGGIRELLITRKRKTNETAYLIYWWTEKNSGRFSRVGLCKM